jgi:ATP-dependent DNA helicase RecG
LPTDLGNCSKFTNSSEGLQRRETEGVDVTPEQLEEYLENGENIEVEFKQSRSKLNKNAFESICAFLNRNGGHLFLGVDDDGIVKGVLPQCVEDICKNIVTSANNPQKLNPPFYLSPVVFDYNDKKIINLYIPQSSQVHRTAGRIYDRNKDGDLDITDQAEQVTKLYLRKQSTYTENKIYPYLESNHFKPELFERIKKLARSERADHPWLEMDNEELLRSASLYKEDFQTNEKGYTLAAVLLLGKDEVIKSVLPHHRTDAILRVENLDRFDDRDDIRVNLIESYDRLMAFVKKHLPDKYYNEGDQRISIRNLIFHEVIGNLLIHREYTNPFPAKLIIEEGRIVVENANRPRRAGPIDPNHFSPYPKNPVIASFFKEIGRADELGSGVRNTFKYCGIYTPGATPELIEDDVFKTIIPLKVDKPLKNDSLSYGEDEEQIIGYVKENSRITLKETEELIQKSRMTASKKLKKLVERGILKRVAESKTDPTAYYEEK